jgi:hypothetical protein
LESPVPSAEDSILHVYADGIQVEGRK